MESFHLEKSHRSLFLALGCILLIIGGFSNFNLMKPLFIVIIAGFIILNWKKNKSFKFDGLTVFLGFLLVAEIISYFNSIYRPNSFLLLDKLFFWALFCYLIRSLLQQVEVRNYLYLFLAFFAIILALVAIFNFTNLNSLLGAYGWGNASQFKTHFSPFGFRNNDWATLAICLLPFPLIAGSIWAKSKALSILSIFSFCMVVYSVLISFSRGAYLSLFLFLLSTFLFIVFLKLIRHQTLGYLLILFVFVLSLFSFTILKPIITTAGMNKTMSQQRSTEGRLEILKQGWCKAKKVLLTGVGGYNYALVDNDCSSVDEDSGYSSFANNLYLQILIEKGIPGLLIYILFFGYILFCFIRSIFLNTDKNEKLISVLLFTGFASYCFRELFFSSFFECNQVMIMVGVYIGLCTPLSLERKIKPENPSKQNRWLSMGITIVTLIFSVCFSYQYWRDHKTQNLLNSNAAVVLNENTINDSLLFDKIPLNPGGIIPYYELAGLLNFQLQDNPNWIFRDSLNIDQNNVSRSLNFFAEGLKLNPTDGNLHFNIGYLLFLQDKSLNSAARNHFEQALKSEPNNIEYLIGYGILCEKLRDSLLADSLYEKALRLDPEIFDSEFFIDLNQRKPDFAKPLLDKTILNLKVRTDSSYNTIYLARLARLYWTKAEYKESKILFQQVLEDLPDLYRPYYYLGKIAEHERDSSLALTYYRKSIFLNNLDYLTPLALGDYYYHRLEGNSRLANSILRYYKDALRNLIQHQTRHRARSKLQYKTGTPLTNDLVLKNLMLYTRTKIDHFRIFVRIADVYSVMGLKDQQAYFLKLSLLDINDLSADDLIFKQESKKFD